MQKIDKPKRINHLKSDMIFEELINEDAYIEGLLFENVVITKVMQGHLYLAKCYFKNVTFESCEFDRIDLTDTTFENCDLSNFKLTDGTIHRCEFINSRLTGSDLSNCSIQQTLFLENSARYANFSYSKFKGVNFIKNQLANSSFNECNYLKVSYDECNLVECEFINTPLTTLDFSTCEIYGAMIPVQSLKGLSVSSEQAIQLAQLLGLKIVS